MLAARPAARPPLPFLQLFPRPPDTALARSLLLGILDPADELVAGQGRDVLPGVECRGVGDQRLAQVSGELVHHPAGESLGAHEPMVLSRAARLTGCFTTLLTKSGRWGGWAFRGAGSGIRALPSRPRTGRRAA